MGKVRQRRRRRRSQRGQGITEYGAIMAFVAVLVGMVFMYIPGQLSVALSGAYASIVDALSTLNAAWSQ